ncbi:hypothetical protein HBI70_207030 [Parastagonospora nodorum]|nr:hypothetical protein HBH49_006320 [Parastagonospora nodorum]KAH4905256.1 hypothetical protein HBI80_098000 [Parastagonospora nodorum]KAH4995081.1 hypothetical protein HBI76_007990 [Parastagonospora nodorum]KAH5065382.1 hypothetical protein HBH96_043340 [Parastagonospora nodorum]KAH5125536.1 hypothetical protein HBH71_008180 [Parastagonospora nodorum]
MLVFGDTATNGNVGQLPFSESRWSRDVVKLASWNLRTRHESCLSSCFVRDNYQSALRCTLTLVGIFVACCTT